MIPLYLTPAAGAAVYRIDNPALASDVVDGAYLPLEGKLLSAPFEAGAWSTFRRFVQFVRFGNIARITVTPTTDGSESADSGEAVYNVAVDGMMARHEVPLAQRGTRHQVRITLQAAGGAALGEFERWLVPRRSAR